MGVQGHHVAVVQGGGAGGADRGVHLERPAVDGLDRPSGGAASGPRLGLDGLIARRLGLAAGPGVGRKTGALVPLGRSGQGATGLDGSPFPLRDDAQKVSVPHDLQDPGHGLHGGGGVEAEQLRAIGGLADDPAVHQTRRVEVLDEDGLAADLGRQVHPGRGLADIAAHRRGLGRDGPGGLALEIPASNQLPVGRLAARRGDRSVHDLQAIDGRVQALGGHLQQDVAHFRRREPNGGPRVGHGEAARRHALARRTDGVAGDDPQTAELDVQFVGADLRQGGQHPLTEFYLAGLQGHRAIGGDLDPGVQLAVAGEVAGQDGA